MDAEWIKHDGGECPIPWAKEGEWEALRMDGSPRNFGCPQGNARESFCWKHEGFSVDIAHYRLTDGWIPILNGVCPFNAGHGEWEWKERSGNTNKFPAEETAKITKHYWGNTGSAAEIVAVRLIKQSVECSTLDDYEVTDEHVKIGSVVVAREANRKILSQDMFEILMSSADAKKKALRDNRVKKNAVPQIGMAAMLTIAGKAMED